MDVVNLTFCVMIKKTLLSLLVTASLTVLLLLAVVSLDLVSEKRADRQRVSFTDINGFSGYVTFNAFYQDQHTPLKTKDANVVITKYKSVLADRMPILAQATIDTANHIPIQFQFVVERKIGNRTVYSKPVQHHRVNQEPMFIKTGDTPTSILSDATIHTRMYH